ncbi:hypothetical protein N8787_05340 [Opitutaceae bacterium]|nr:hypothetical protein [Opitutaceae bacterium]
MPLETFFPAQDANPPPPATLSFLEEADSRCDAFFDSGVRKKIPRFIPADYNRIFQAINAVKASDSLLGNRFCEWGSGLGTATCLASLMGFNALGIEIEPELVLRARRLASEFNLPASFLQTSFLIEGYDFLPTQGGYELLRPSGNPALGVSYPDSDWELEEIDLFYVYPWPEEQEATLKYFECVASEGAIIIAYLGEGEPSIYRKIID